MRIPCILPRVNQHTPFSTLAFLANWFLINFLLNTLIVSAAQGWARSSRLALVVVSHRCFAASLYLVGRYMDRRYGTEHTAARSAALLGLAFVPVGMFFHLCYAESLFLLLCIVELYLIDGRAHPLLVA